MRVRLGKKLAAKINGQRLTGKKIDSCRMLVNVGLRGK
jgi:hypothetical protein